MGCLAWTCAAHSGLAVFRLDRAVRAFRLHMARGLPLHSGWLLQGRTPSATAARMPAMKTATAGTTDLSFIMVEREPTNAPRIS